MLQRQAESGAGQKAAVLAVAVFVLCLTTAAHALGTVILDPGDLFRGGINRLVVRAEVTSTGEIFTVEAGPDDIIDNAGDRRLRLDLPPDEEIHLVARAFEDTEYRATFIAFNLGDLFEIEDGAVNVARFLPVQISFSPRAIELDRGALATFQVLLTGPDGERIDTDTSIYDVAFNVPPLSGSVAAGDFGYNYQAGNTPGEYEIKVTVYLNGEPVNPADELGVILPVRVLSAFAESPAGLAIDGANRIYISDIGDGTQYDGFVALYPPGQPGFPFVTGLDRPGDIEIGPRGHSLVIALGNGKVEKRVFGISGRVLDAYGSALIGARVIAQGAITGTPGLGDTISQARTGPNGRFHLFHLLRPPVGSVTVDVVVTVEYRGRTQVYEITVGPDGQTVQDIVFAGRRLIIDIDGNGATEPHEGISGFFHNQVVELKAAAGAGWRFAGWQGDLVSDDPEEAILMDKDKTVTAVFEPASK